MLLRHCLKWSEGPKKNILHRNLFIDGSCNLFLCLLIASQPDPPPYWWGPCPASFAPGMGSTLHTQLSTFAILANFTPGGCQLPGVICLFPLSTCPYVGIINIFQSIDFWSLWMLSMLMMSVGRTDRARARAAAAAAAAAETCVPTNSFWIISTNYLDFKCNLE